VSQFFFRHHSLHQPGFVVFSVVSIRQTVPRHYITQPLGCPGPNVVCLHNRRPGDSLQHFGVLRGQFKFFVGRV
jgi:hypothetical protein